MQYRFSNMEEAGTKPNEVRCTEENTNVKQE